MGGSIEVDITNHPTVQKNFLGVNRLFWGPFPKHSSSKNLISGSLSTKYHPSRNLKKKLKNFAIEVGTLGVI